MVFYYQACCAKASPVASIKLLYQDGRNHTSTRTVRYWISLTAGHTSTSIRLSPPNCGLVDLKGFRGIMRNGRWDRYRVQVL